MKRWKVICVITAAACLVSGTAFPAEKSSDELTAASDALSAARLAQAVYRKQIMDKPQFVAFRKELDESRSAYQAKGEELSRLLDKKLTSDKAYAEAMGKSNELAAVRLELSKVRTAIESDPAVIRLRQEAILLRTKIATIEKEANETVDSKYNSDTRVKELLARRDQLAEAAQKADTIRNAVMEDPDIKALRSQAGELREKILEKARELQKMYDDMLKSDEQYLALDAKAKEAAEKLASLRNRAAEASAAKRKAR